MDALLDFIDSRPTPDGHVMRFSAMYQELSAFLSTFRIRYYDEYEGMISTFTVSLFAVLGMVHHKENRRDILRCFLQNLVDLLTGPRLSPFPSSSLSEYFGSFDFIRRLFGWEEPPIAVFVHVYREEPFEFHDAQFYVRHAFSSSFHDEYRNTLSIALYAFVSALRALPPVPHTDDAEQVEHLIQQFRLLELRDNRLEYQSFYNNPDQVELLLHF